MSSYRTWSPPFTDLGRPRRRINVTFQVDYLVLGWARARAFREGKSLNWLVDEYLELYSGISVPEEEKPRRRVPVVKWEDARE
jgi:hypothetical protein